MVRRIKLVGGLLDGKQLDNRNRPSTVIQRVKKVCPVLNTGVKKPWIATTLMLKKEFGAEKPNSAS